MGVSTGREIVMYINSKFKGLEVNETHFQVPKMGGYTRHIQDYYFEHDFFFTLIRGEPIRSGHVTLHLLL